jgi:hypothetical protein
MDMNVSELKDTPPWDWPDDAGRALLDILRDDAATESDLLLASELAGDLTVIDDALAEALLAVVHRGDRSEQIRSNAAISLGPVLEYADTEGFADSDDLPITERMLERLTRSLHDLYLDAGVPGTVRRSILEASVRAPRDWHQAAVRAAFDGDDDAWRLTAVFCMRFVSGCDDQILEALDSANPQIRYEAIAAAGNWEIDAAWPHVVALARSRQTEKPLLLAAIEAIASLRPDEAGAILADLADSDDEDVVEAVEEAMAIAAGASDEDGHDDLNDDEF